jgi:hypothetical protein
MHRGDNDERKRRGGFSKFFGFFAGYTIGRAGWAKVEDVG